MKSYFDWRRHPEISAFVAERYTAKGPTDLARLIAERYGIYLRPHQVRKRWRVLTGSNREPECPVPAPESEPVDLTAVFKNQNEPPDFTRIAAMYAAATEEVERKEADQLGQTFLTVDFGASQLPVGICFSSDWQIGTNGVMMRQLQEDVGSIAAADGLHCILMGDLIQNQNMVKHPSSMHQMTLPNPQEQIDCVRWLIHELLGGKPLDPACPKVLGAVTGNHEENTKKAAGLDPTRALCMEFGIPYLWHGAKVEVRVGKSDYVLGVRHLFRGESSINTTNAQRTMYQQWLPADVEVLGHRHYNDLQKRPVPGGDTIFLRAGSYQKWDEHGQFSGGFKGQWGLPLIVLFPNEKRIVPFYGSDFALGLQFLEDQRRRYREKNS